MNNKPCNKSTYIIISHATNLDILNKNFSTFVQCKINPPSLFGLTFSYDKKFFGVKRVVQKRSMLRIIILFIIYMYCFLYYIYIYIYTYTYLHILSHTIFTEYMLKLIQPHQECFDAEKYKKYLEKERLREKIDINNINIDNEKEVELYEDYLLNYKYNKREVEKNAILPLSLLSSSFIRRAIYSNRENILKNLKNINWKRYCCNVKGVRWHASGAWRVYFCKRNYQHNFFVKCDCYFRVSIYGFEKSKELAVLYRKRLEYEYILLMKRWKEIEM